MKPGIYQMTASEYNRDPAPTPSLSSSIAHILTTDSPLHAWTKSPRLNPDFLEEDSKPMDIGKAVHSIILEGADIVEYLNYKDWRKDAAQDARDAIRKGGKIPLLEHQRADIDNMVEAVRIQLAHHKDAHDAFTSGKPEQSILWQEEGVWCRARPDWLHDSYLKIDDLKTSGITANPETVSRTLFNNGMDIQCAWYLRGLKAVTGKDAQFRFVFIETAPPYALSVVALGPDSMTIGEKKVQFAIDLWRKCLTEDRWPGYASRTAYAELPPYVEAAWLRKELEEIR